MKHSYKKRLMSDIGTSYGIFNTNHECVGTRAEFSDAYTCARLYGPGTFVLNRAGDIAYTCNA